MPPTTCADLLRTITSEPGRPRITWYGDAGERVELSGAVLENWVNKTTNLLVEEFDVGPGTRVLLDLPPHWRTVVWALAVWRAGACVVTSETVREPTDLIVTDAPAPHAGEIPLVVVALPALARRFDGDLPAGAIDAASAVMTYGDVISGTAPIDPACTAVVDASTSISHAELIRPPGPSEEKSLHRVLLEVDAKTSIVAHLRDVLDALAAGGSVVIVAGDALEAVRADAGRRARLVATERLTSMV